MTIEHRAQQGPIVANMAEASCFTCWSAGKILRQVFNGYEGSDPISHTQLYSVEDAAAQHEKKTGGTHNIVIFEFKNDPIEHNTHTYRDGALVIEPPPEDEE